MKICARNLEDCKEMVFSRVEDERRVNVALFTNGTRLNQTKTQGLDPLSIN